MPNYTFEDTETGETFIEFMPMDSKDQFLKDNPHLKFVFVPIATTGDHLMGVGPTEPTAFKERMGEIADTHPYSPMAEKWGTSATASKRKSQTVYRNATKKYEGKLDSILKNK